jgi:NodT family efflux transporter outer membrane factor (OMF) lipoprotein
MRPARSHTLRPGFALLLAALWGAGCAVHHSQPAPLATPVPPAFVAGGSDPAGGGLPQRWWEIFDDPTLDALMAQAFAANLDLAQAYARIAQAQSLARQGQAARLPGLDFQAQAGRSRQLGNAGGVAGNNYALSLAAGYEVDLWNKLKSRAQARELESDATLEELRTLYLSLSAQVADLYYLMVEQRALLDLTEQTVTARREVLDLVERRYREGVVPALDVYQARQVLAAAYTRLPELESTLLTTAHFLSILTGQYPNPNSGGALATLPDLPAAFPAGLPSELLGRRPDVRADLLRLMASDHEIGAAVAARFPSINLVGGFGRSGSDFGTGLSATVWSLLGNLALPLVDWGARKAEVDRTQAVFRERLARYQRTVLTAFQEVEDALVQNRTTLETIRRIEAELSAAEASLRLSTDRYLDGLSDYLPVLTAQALYFDSQSRLLSARRRLLSARIGLARALGGSWMNPEIEKTLQR